MLRNISVIGVGNMAKAIIGGIISSKLPVANIFLFDKFPESCASFENDSRFTVTKSIEEAVENGDVVLLSVKPQNYPEVLEQIKNASGFSDKVYISIGAGISVKSVSDALDGVDVVRALPNLPMTIGKGVCAICKTKRSIPRSLIL